MTRFVTIVAALAVSVGAALSAEAAPRGRWLEPTVLAEGGGYDVHLGVAANGTVVALWTGGGVEAAIRAPGGSWQPAAALGSAIWPRLAVDAAGNALAIAVQQDGRIVSFTRAAGASRWSAPSPVSEEDIWNGLGLAGNAAGQAIAVWVGNDGLLVARASFRRADGSWGAPENLGYAGDLSPRVAIDGRGNAVADWTRGSEGAAEVYAEFRHPDTGWEQPVVLSRRGASTYAQFDVAMNRRGDALAVWGELGDSGATTLVSAMRRAGSNSWSPPARVPISSPDTALYNHGGLSFGLDENGAATLVAQTTAGSVEAVTQAAGATTWTGPVVLGSGDGGSGAWYASDRFCVDPRVAVDGAGGAVVIWGGDALRAARRRAGSTAWDPAAVLATRPACFARDVAVDASGNAAVTWNDGLYAGAQLDAVILDLTPPVLGRIVAPRTAFVRRRVAMSVTASDLWSSLDGPPRWEFGDGTAARGRAVSHAYRRPGCYRITVTARDAAGNSATSTAKLIVLRRR